MHSTCAFVIICAAIVGVHAIQKTQFPKNIQAVVGSRSPPSDVEPKTIKIVNVGLVSTGTTSFHAALTQLGLVSYHAPGDNPWTQPSLKNAGDDMGVFNPSNLSLTATDSVLARVLQKADAFHDIPFMAPDVIQQTEFLRQLHPRKFVIVATNRSRSSWVASMKKSEVKGGAAFRRFYHPPLPLDCPGSCIGPDRWYPMGTPTDTQWAEAYDKHQSLLLSLNIPVINLEDPDATKWSVLCSLLQDILPAFQKCQGNQASSVAWANACTYNCPPQ